MQCQNPAVISLFRGTEFKIIAPELYDVMAMLFFDHYTT